MKKLLILIFFILFGFSVFAAENIRILHEKILYPVVRIEFKNLGGSGTVIYSKKQPNNKCKTFVLTNHHVIANAISVVKEWDALLKIDIKREKKEIVRVDIFRYTNLSVSGGRTSWDADIITYNKDEDLALLELRSEDCYAYVAKLLPRNKVTSLRIFMKTFAVGAALARPPFPTEGRITSLNVLFENLRYEMSSAQIIFGNSGGSMFLQDTLEFIGIPSRVSVAGFSTIVVHMGFYIPIERIYNWFEKEKIRFLYNSKFTVNGEFKLRKQMQEEAKRGREVNNFR